MTTLCFDFGNTRLKCAIFIDRKFSDVVVLQNASEEEILELIEKYHPQKSILSHYALLNAAENFKKGKRSGWFKRTFSHRFSFLQNYYLKLGFLDGREGYWIAKMTAHYTFLKYARLYELNKMKK
jgi:hypothetical protein